MYKCRIHNTNEGFIEDGKWICWKCYYNNRYLYPKGKLVDKAYIKHKNIEVRLLITRDSEHPCLLEVWQNGKLIMEESYKYLSQATRAFKSELEARSI